MIPPRLPARGGATVASSYASLHEAVLQMSPQILIMGDFHPVSARKTFKVCRPSCEGTSWAPAWPVSRDPRYKQRRPSFVGPSCQLTSETPFPPTAFSNPICHVMPLGNLVDLVGRALHVLDPCLTVRSPVQAKDISQHTSPLNCQVGFHSTSQRPRRATVQQSRRYCGVKQSATIF